MGITLATLKENKRTVPIEFDELTFNVTYRPGAITPTFGEERANNKDWLIDVLLKLIDTWDVYEDDAQTVRAPINAEMLSSEAFGVSLLKLMYDTILDDAFLPKAPRAS